jgi:DNA primase
MSDIEEIKSRLDIVDLVGEHVQLRKSGRNYSGFCPFHANTKTPSFYVFPETQTWRCFGACSEGGDVFSFAMKKNGWDFKEALVELAKRAGVTLEERRPADKVKLATEERLLALLDTAAEYYHQLLLHAPQAADARAYVDGRALSPETQAAFRLGFALESWDAARNHFNGQGYSDDDLLAAGLLTENEERGTRYDRFRNRLMIPIHNIDGRVVGFGARTLDPDGVPKYLNSPQTMLFDKSALLYGLDTARKPIRAEGQVVIVEGYMDVMQAWQAGYRNLVAQMGTALTEYQLRQLQRLTRRFILALDADAAGVNATLRGLQLARQTLDRDIEIRFDARGLVQMEGRLKADIRIVTLPEGNDPDKIIRTDPEAWPRLLKGARPVVEYIIDVTTRDLAADDAKGKADVARQVMPLISDIADPVERDHYRRMLAKKLQVDEEALRQTQAKQRGAAQAKTRQKAARQVASPPEPPPPPDEFDGAPRLTTVKAGSRLGRRRRKTAALEMNFLRECLATPGALTRVNAILRKHKMLELTRDDFEDTRDRELFAEVAFRATQQAVAGIDELCDSLDAVLAERVRALFSSSPLTPETPLDRLPDALALSVLDWRLEKLRERNAVLSALLVEARTGASGGTSEEYGAQLLAVQAEMLQINKAQNDMTALGRRRMEESQSGRKPR